MAQMTRDLAFEDLAELATLASDQAANAGLSAMAHCLQIEAPLHIHF